MAESIETTEYSSVLLRSALTYQLAMARDRAFVFNKMEYSYICRPDFLLLLNFSVEDGRGGDW